jgi:hypothetical protein
MLKYHVNGVRQFLSRSYVLLACMLCAVGLLSTTVTSQVVTSSCKDDFILNRATFPARIGYMPLGAYYTLENHSDKRIIHYRLGCVVEESRALKVVYRDKEQIIDLPSADPSTKSVPFVYIGLRQLKGKCLSKGAKAAIVEITFSDGSVWKINGNP